MLGNASEWCVDTARGLTSKPAKRRVDPISRRKSGTHVVRGGGFWSLTDQSRCASRHTRSTSWGDVRIGFRAAFSMPE